MNQNKEENYSSLSYIQHTASRFLDHETFGGLLLIFATIFALVLGNSPWAEAYHHYLQDEFLFQLTDHFSFGLSVEEWINGHLLPCGWLGAQTGNNGR